MSVEDTNSETVNLKDFAALAGFPTELVKKELFESDIDTKSDEVSLETLRDAMVNYLNQTFLDEA